jgi:membrane-bound ClpP family serine protease
MTSKLEILIALSDEIFVCVILISAVIGLSIFTGLIDILTAVLISVIVVCVVAIITYKSFKPQFFKPKIGIEAMIGKRGETVTPLNPAGMVQIDGEYWKAVSQVPIEEGVMVETVGVEGLKLLVKKTSEG